MTKKALFKAVLIPCLLLFIVLFLPISTHAGFFSALAGVWGVSAERTKVAQTANSQTIGLLEPARSHDLGNVRGGGDIVVLGGAVLLPEVGPSGSGADTVVNHSSGHISTYVVREGDSLSLIASMFGVSVNTIKWANDISNISQIAPGDTLVILPVSGIRHAVVSGDTLASLAKQYKGNIEEIVQYNDLSLTSVLSVGDTVIIPDGEIPHTFAQSVRQISSGSHDTSGPDYSGYYFRPITGGIKTQGIHGYNGVDLASYFGAPILAAASGEVIVSKNGGWNGGYGSYIVLKHPNDTQTLYAHLSDTSVAVGAWVRQGETIGVMGSTGKSTGTHLHFEVRGAQNPF